MVDKKPSRVRSVKSTGISKFVFRLFFGIRVDPSQESRFHDNTQRNTSQHNTKHTHTHTQNTAQHNQHKTQHTHRTQHSTTNTKHNTHTEHSTAQPTQNTINTINLSIDHVTVFFFLNFLF